MSVSVIHSAPKVNPKANDAVYSDKRDVDASGAEDSFSDSLNEELNAIKDEPETLKKTNATDETEPNDEQTGQENSALAHDVLPLSFSVIKPQGIDETISALNNIEEKSAPISDVLPFSFSEIKPQDIDIDLDETSTVSKEIQEQSVSVNELLPLSFSVIKSQDIDIDIDLDETISALNEIVAQLGGEKKNLLADDEASLLSGDETSLLADDEASSLSGDESINLLDGHFPLKNALAQLDKQLNSKPENAGINTAKQALLNADAKQRLANQAGSVVELVKGLTDKVEVATPLLLKTEKLDNEAKGYSELSKELGSTKREFNLSSLNSAVKQDVILSDLPADKTVAKLTDIALSSQLQGSDNSANKNMVADLASLSRQVESMQANKQEVPAMTKQLNHPEWKQEFNDRIIWMQNKGISSAELRINPNNLGPISISIKMDADQQANISINVQNAAVRDAVESALPRLREMLNAQQIALADVNVSQQQQQGQNNARAAMEEAQQESNKQNADKLDNLDENSLETDNLADEIISGRAVASNGLLSLYA